MGELICAVEYIRIVSGGTQPHLMRCSDDKYYVIKFQKNPQGSRVLANDLIGTRLAERMGLPVAPCKLISEDCAPFSKYLYFETPKGNVPCPSGVCFRSEFVDYKTGNVPWSRDIYSALDAMN